MNSQPFAECQAGASDLHADIPLKLRPAGPRLFPATWARLPASSGVLLRELRWAVAAASTISTADLREIVSLLPRFQEALGARQAACCYGPPGTPAECVTRGEKLLAVRPREVLQNLKRGLSEKEIAREMGLSPNTVHVYVKTIYRHFGVRSRPELLALWVQVA